MAHPAGDDGPIIVRGFCRPVDQLLFGWPLSLERFPSYGDPLEREPQQVLEDLRDGLIDRGEALRDYGVVIGPDLQIDKKETERIRASRRG